jgi:hypothetical protein
LQPPSCVCFASIGAAKVCEIIWFFARAIFRIVVILFAISVDHRFMLIFQSLTETSSVAEKTIFLQRRKKFMKIFAKTAIAGAMTAHGAASRRAGVTRRSFRGRRDPWEVART